MSRRVRTSTLTLNGYGHYVFYMATHQNSQPVSLTLHITSGPHAGSWTFSW